MSPVELATTAVLAVGVACVMEPWSRIVHERLWHGLLYIVHRTHHPERPKEGLEANDVFSLVHAVPAGLLLYVGLSVFSGAKAVVAVGVGTGLCLYGLVYTVVHDGLVHGRLPVGFLNRWRFFRRVRAAHTVHHRTGGPPYGLFLGPRELRQARRQGKGKNGEAVRRRFRGRG